MNQIERQMMPEPHFLVPLDSSGTAPPHYTYALALGTTLRARLTLRHDVNIPHFIQPVPTAYRDAITNRIKQGMDDYRQRFITVGVDAEAVLAHDAPRHEIVHTARLKAVNLIIIGKYARPGVEHALLGSAAEKVVRLASCPVLVAPLTRPPS